MKKILLASVLLYSLCFNLYSQMEFSGFVDFNYSKQEGGNSSFGIGSLEIDMEREFSKTLSFEGAFVIEDEEISMGQTLLNIKTRNNLNFQIGLIDMPFGLDWKFFATPDRKTITPPITTEKLFDGGWSDIGVNFSGNSGKLNFNFYVVNGFGEDKGSPVNQIQDNNNAKTSGARIGFTPSKNLEAGISFMQGPYLDNNNSDLLSRTGFDFSYTSDRLQVKAEYIKGTEESPVKTKNSMATYLHLTKEISKKLYTAVRFGYYKEEKLKPEKRYTLALGKNFTDDTRCTAEYQIRRESPSVKNNLFSMQVVVSF